MYFSVLFIIVGLFVNFENPTANNILEFFLSSVTLIAVFFGMLWLRNCVILIGFVLYLISFNFGLLFNPLLFEPTLANDSTVHLLLNLDILATVTVIVGLLGDRYFKPNLQFQLTSMLLLTIIGTIIFQVIIRLFVSGYIA